MGDKYGLSKSDRDRVISMYVFKTHVIWISDEMSCVYVLCRHLPSVQIRIRITYNKNKFKLCERIIVKTVKVYQPQQQSKNNTWENEFLPCDAFYMIPPRSVVFFWMVILIQSIFAELCSKIIKGAFWMPDCKKKFSFLTFHPFDAFSVAWWMGHRYEGLRTPSSSVEQKITNASAAERILICFLYIISREVLSVSLQS